MSSPRDLWRSRLWLASLLFFLTLVTFIRTTHCGFTNHDDPEYIYANPHVRTGLSWANLRWAFSALHADVSYWHPLTWLSHQFDCQWFGLNPGAHHLTSVWLHVANTLLLFVVLSQLGVGNRSSFFVAALFALHPLHVESVAWVAERKDVLYTCFWLASFSLYLKANGRRASLSYALSLVSFVAALMAKPTAVTLPVVLVLVELFWRQTLSKGTSFHRRFSARTLALDVLPFALLAAGSAVLTLAAQSQLGTVQSLAALPLSDRLDNALVAYCSYLRKTIVPIDLCVSYVQTRPYTVLEVTLAAAVLTAISWWAVRVRKTNALVALGWFWFVLTLLPNIGLIQVGAQSMADRYTYIPLVGVFLMLGGIASQVIRSFNVRRIAEGFGGVVLVALAAISVHQISFWANGVTLFQRAIAVNPNNWVAQLGLGMALTEQRRFDEALPFLHQAAFSSGNPIEAHKRLGVCLFWKGDMAGALPEFEAALQGDPSSAETCFFIAEILSTHPDATFRDTTRAVSLAEQGLKLHPDARPDQWLTLSSAYAVAGRFPEAVRAGERAAQLARELSDPVLLDRVDQRLRLYKQGKPFIKPLQHA